MAGETVLELVNVSRHFGALRAVDGVSLKVTQGERLAVIGPNGAGKTTLFNLITGDLTPTSGQVRLFSQDVSRMPTNRRVAMGLARTYQITQLFMNLTVEENLMIGVQGLEGVKLSPFRSPWSIPALRERVEAAARQVGIWELRDRVIKYLSYGDQRRLEVALALSSRPKLLLLDEPMAGLSPGDRPELARMIQSLPRDISIVLIEHDIDIAFRVAERVVVLHHGQQVAEGTPDEIRNNKEVQEIYLGVA